MKLPKIAPIDERAREAARRRWDSLTKPPGSLGRLEGLAIQVAGMTGRPQYRPERKVIFTVAADHGVVEEGVSAYPQVVTGQMVRNFLRQGAAINVLARHVGAQVIVVDAGVCGRIPSHRSLVSLKIRQGTGNFSKEPAMNRREAERVVRAGSALFERHRRGKRIDLVGLGDMGIGNTAASAALTAVFTGRPVDQVTGRGTGLDEAGLARKVRVIERALKLHRPDPQDPIDCLSKVGGLEIGCLAGIALAAAQARVPVVLDGFIATTAGMVACRLAPEARNFFIASHQSVESGHVVLLKGMGLHPLLDLQMRLGEGTGACLGIFLVEAALKLLSEMATFSEAQVAEKES